MNFIFDCFDCCKNTQDDPIDVRPVKTTQKKKLDYIVFSGGGLRGIAHCGALLQLENMCDMKFKGIAGTSMGAIIAALLAIGCSADEIKTVIEVDLDKFFDDEMGILRDTIHLVEKWGIAPGKILYDTLGKLIEEKTGNKDFTIHDLHAKTSISLVINAVNLNKRKLEYFWHGNSVPIRDAVRASMAIPPIFSPHCINGDYYIDGGLIDNYPIHVFSSFPGDVAARNMQLELPEQLLGLNIITNPNYLNDHAKISNIVECYSSIVLSVMNENQIRVVNYDYTAHTIDIVTKNTSFEINNDQKEELLIAGRDAIIQKLV